MKKRVLFLSLSIAALVLSSCANQSKQSISMSSDLSSQDLVSQIDENKQDQQYLYNFTFDDIVDAEEKKAFERNLCQISDYTTAIEVFGIVHQVNSVTYQTSVEGLVDNYYHIPPETVIENDKIVSDEVLVTANIDYTNNSDKEVEYYLNSFYLQGISTNSPKTWIYGICDYQDKVMYPEEVNKSYFRIFIKPKSTHNATIGFFVDKKILECANVYLQITRQDTITDNTYYLKLPPYQKLDAKE